MDRWISLKFWILLRLIKSWRKKLVSQMQFFVSSLTSFKEGVPQCKEELVCIQESTAPPITAHSLQSPLCCVDHIEYFRCFLSRKHIFQQLYVWEALCWCLLWWDMSFQFQMQRYFLQITVFNICGHYQVFLLLIMHFCIPGLKDEYWAGV